MTANEAVSMNFLFPALLAALVIILFLLRRTILTERLETQVLQEAHSKISSLTTQQEQWAETVQKTQEKLVMMFLALEETKEYAAILPSIERDKSEEKIKHP